jgi:mannose-6-phosphate isomerase-like protein (cupin superfamily)
MRTKSLTSEQMEARVARFNKLQTYQRQNFEAHNIPPGAVEKVAARRVYPVMAPADYQGRSAGAPVKGPRGLIVSIAECEPGNGPGLHRHLNTVENFFCLSGRFEIAWGDRGEHTLVLEPLDMIAVPRGENRSFRNISNELGRLLVKIVPETDEQVDPKRLRRSTARLRWKACKRSVSSLRMNRARERLDAHGRASVAALEPARFVAHRSRNRRPYSTV